MESDVYAYIGNVLGVSPNPTGGQQFVVSSATGLGMARAQHVCEFEEGRTFTMSWDMLAKLRALPPALDYIGSISLQPSATSNGFQQLMYWGDHRTIADAFEVGYGVHFASGTTNGGIDRIHMSPGPEWRNLFPNHWYRQTVVWSFASNKLLRVSIRDLTANGPTATVDVSALGWYLSGGSNNVLGLISPTDIRLFGGGAGIGNVASWDNIRIELVPVCHGQCLADNDDGTGSGNPDGGVTIEDLLYFLILFAEGRTCADLDNGSSTGTPDGGVTIDDLLYFLLRYEQGC